MTILTKQEQAQFDREINQTKGLSKSGQKARLTMLLGQAEVSQLKAISEAKGLSLGQCAVWIIQQHQPKANQQEKK